MGYSSGFCITIRMQELMDYLGIRLADKRKREDSREILDELANNGYIEDINGFVTDYKTINNLLLQTNFSDEVMRELQREDRGLVDLFATKQEAIKHARRYVLRASLNYAKERISEDGIFSNDLKSRIEGIDKLLNKIYESNISIESIEPVAARYLKQIAMEYNRRRLEQQKTAVNSVNKGRALRALASQRRAEQPVLS